MRLSSSRFWLFPKLSISSARASESMLYHLPARISSAVVCVHLKKSRAYNSVFVLICKTFRAWYRDTVPHSILVNKNNQYLPSQISAYIIFQQPAICREETTAMARKSREQTTEHTRVVGYVRVSSEQQTDHGVSLQAQEEKIRQYCALYDLTLVEIVIEAGVSAKTLQREGLQKALTMLKSGQADGLVVV